MELTARTTGVVMPRPRRARRSVASGPLAAWAGATEQLMLPTPLTLRLMSSLLLPMVAWIRRWCAAATVLRMSTWLWTLLFGDKL